MCDSGTGEAIVDRGSDKPEFREDYPFRFCGRQKTVKFFAYNGDFNLFSLCSMNSV